MAGSSTTDAGSDKDLASTGFDPQTPAWILHFDLRQDCPGGGDASTCGIFIGDVLGTDFLEVNFGCSGGAPGNAIVALQDVTSTGPTNPTVPFTFGVTHPIRLEWTGTDLRVFVDGVLRLTQAGADVTAVLPRIALNNIATNAGRATLSNFTLDQ